MELLQRHNLLDLFFDYAVRFLSTLRPRMAFSERIRFAVHNPCLFVHADRHGLPLSLGLPAEPKRIKSYFQLVAEVKGSAAAKEAVVNKKLKTGIVTRQQR